MIDQAHHQGGARRALEETLMLDKTVESSIAFLKENGILEETLLLVTSDHSHTLTINGYPNRGNNILGT
jgi:alkaline phosphatase